MRPSPLLLNNIHQLINMLGVGELDACPHCNRNFSNVKPRYERLSKDGTFITFIECPGCRGEFVYRHK